jgi:hypothetical protein
MKWYPLPHTLAEYTSRHTRSIMEAHGVAQTIENGENTPAVGNGDVGDESSREYQLLEVDVDASAEGPGKRKREDINEQEISKRINSEGKVAGATSYARCACSVCRNRDEG